MKNLIFALATFGLLISCTTMVRVATTTHEQIMDQYKTREEVIQKFGIPTSKRTDGPYEEWYYLLGTKTITDKSATLNALLGNFKTKNTSTDKNNMVVGGMSSGTSNNSSNSTSNTGANANAAARTISQEVKTFVKFTFKENDVINWESSGVDYGIYEMVKK